METWIKDYVAAQHRALDSVPLDRVAAIVALIREAWDADRQIFVAGNGGNAANGSHFATDLGKGASDKMPRRFRVLSLSDNVAWITALGNDYAYEDIFLRQLENYARAGDVLIAGSVSGNSPNLVKAFTWAREHKLRTVALVGGKGGRMAELGDEVIRVNDTHYGRVEDVQMHIFHMICYAFMENQA